MENQKTNEKYGFYNAVITSACLVWAIASIALMVFFTGMNQVTYAIMVVGQLFLVMGIILLNRKKLSGALVSLTGISCIIIPAVNRWGGLFSANAKGDNIFPILLSVAIGMIGLAMMIVPEVLEEISKSKCKKVVKAECVDLDENHLQDGSVAYAPVYQYEYNGNIYTKCTNKYKKTGVATVGSNIELRINEFKPTDVYIPASKASKMVIYIIGASLFVMGLGMILTILGI